MVFRTLNQHCPTTARHLSSCADACHNGSGKDVFVDGNHPGRARRWLAAVVKLLIVALVVWYIRRTIVDAWEQLGEHRWQFDAGWLVASGGLYLLATLLCGIFWHRALRAPDNPWAWGRRCGRTMSDTWENMSPERPWW